VITLRRNANLSTGGTSTDVTDLIHSDVAAMCCRAAAAVGLDVCGVDIRLADIAAPLLPPGHPLLQPGRAQSGHAGPPDEWRDHLRAPRPRAGGDQRRGADCPALGDELPGSFGGAASYLVANALAAIAACRSLGVSVKDIRWALATFTADAANPGRGNIYLVHGIPVIVDYGHNAAALAAMGRLVTTSGAATRSPPSPCPGTAGTTWSPRRRRVSPPGSAASSSTRTPTCAAGGPVR
jgi:hypothetical protein